MAGNTTYAINITNSSAQVNSQINASSGYYGGIAGSAAGNIKNSFAKVNADIQLNTTNTSSIVNIASFVGSYSSGTISDCYTTGAVDLSVNIDCPKFSGFCAYLGGYAIIERSISTVDIK